jgi:two-component system, NarL family, sensor histidine kinase UhpB
MRSLPPKVLSVIGPHAVRQNRTRQRYKPNHVSTCSSIVSVSPSTRRSTLLDAIEQAGALVFRYSTQPTLAVDYVSPSFQALVGLSPDLVQADPVALFDAVHPDDRATLESVLSDDSPQPLPVTVRWRHRDGREVWTEGHRFPIYDGHGRVVGFAGFAFDVTDRVKAGVHSHPDLNASALRALSERLEQMREEERTRIARELHDELGQLLTGAKLDFSSTIRRLQELRTPGDVVDRLQAAMGQVEIGIAMVRRIATDLRPPGLDHRDLGAAMEYEARRVAKKTGLQITVANRVDIVVEPEIATVAFRVFQEALTNVARHAEANTVTAAAAIRRGQRLVLFISDDGVGISEEALRGNRSIGLLGMRERARAVGGSIRITSRRGGGTRVLLNLPLQQP